MVSWLRTPSAFFPGAPRRRRPTGIQRSGNSPSPAKANTPCRPDGLPPHQRQAKGDATLYSGSLTLHYDQTSNRTLKIDNGLTTTYNYSMDSHHLQDHRIAAMAMAPPDTDGDGIADSQDNCRLHPNPEQRDTDGDGFGNRCDADLDNNGFVSFNDLTIFRELFNQPPGPGAVSAPTESRLFQIQKDCVVGHVL